MSSEKGFHRSRRPGPAQLGCASGWVQAARRCGEISDDADGDLADVIETIQRIRREEFGEREWAPGAAGSVGGGDE